MWRQSTYQITAGFQRTARHIPMAGWIQTNLCPLGVLASRECYALLVDVQQSYNPSKPLTGWNYKTVTLSGEYLDVFGKHHPFIHVVLDGVAGKGTIEELFMPAFP